LKTFAGHKKRIIAMLSSSKNHYLLPLLTSLSMHTLMLILLLCGIYADKLQQHEHADPLPSVATVLFNPAFTQQPPVQLTTASAPTTAAATQHATPQTQPAAPQPTPQAPSTTTSSSAPHTPTHAAAALQTAHAESAEHPAQPPATPHPASPLAARRRWQAAQAHEATTKLAQLSSGIASALQKEDHDHHAAAATQHTVQKEMTATVRQHYFAKIWKLFKATFDSQKAPLFAQDLDVTATFLLIINHDGKLIDVRLHHNRTMGELAAIEELLIRTAHKVGFFPPVPASFNTDQLTVRCPIHIQTRHGLNLCTLTYEGK
jgi:hypothetical protein